MSNKLVTISREYGSGGHEIGVLLAERLGIPIYDKELLTLAVKDDTLTSEFLEKFDEKKAPTSFSLIFGNMSAVGYQPSANDLTFFKTAETMKQLAEMGDAIIIGRCADYVLRDLNPLNVFVYSDMNFKIKRRIALLKEHEGIELSPEDMKKKILFVDKQRARYYEYYTDRKWGNIHNYDICINTAKVSIPEAVDIIAKCLEKDK